MAPPTTPLPSAAPLPPTTTALHWWIKPTPAQRIPAIRALRWPTANTSSLWTATTGWPPDFTEKLVSAAEAHTADLVIAPFWMVYPENYVEHIRPWEKALQHVLQRNPPRTRAYGYLPAGVYTGQEYAKHLIQKPNTFYYGSPCNKLYRRDLLRKHSLHFRKELFAEDQLFNTEYLRYVRTAVSIPDIGYYYLQNSQSVSHSRVTTADILSLRRRVMLLYRDIYTELGIYPETRAAAILRSAFGENEFTLPPLDTPQTHCCKL